MIKQKVMKPGKGKGVGFDRKVLKEIHGSSMSKDARDYILAQMGWKNYYDHNYK